MKFILPLLLFAFQSLGAVYYIDATGGNNSNDGLGTGTAWQTFANATNISSVIRIGDTILLKRGETWNDTFVFPTNSVTLDAYGTGNLPIVDCQTVRRKGVYTGLATNTITRNIFICNSGGGTGGLWEGNLGSNTVMFCVISNATVDSGAAVGGSAIMGVFTNDISYCADEGVTQHSLTKAWVIGNTIHHNVEGLNNSGTEMTLYSEGNIWYENGDGTGSGGNLGAVDHTTCTFSREIFRDRVDGVASKFFTGGISNVYFYYCTFDASHSSSSTQPSWLANCPTVMLNCVFYGNGTGAFYCQNSATTSITNCIASGYTRFAALSGSGTLYTDHCILFNIPSDANSTQTANTDLLTSDPKFIAPASANFRLQATSPAINAGVNVGLTTDLAGNPVSNPPEIGAYEIVTSSGNAPRVSGGIRGLRGF